MRKLLALVVLGLLLCLPTSQAQIVGPYTQAICSSIAILNAGPTGLTKMITGAAGKVIYICGWQITNTAVAGTVAFAFGTGVNCAVNTAATAALSVGTTPITDHQQWAFFSVPSIAPFATATQNDFCINPSVATISANVYFGQY